MTCHPNRFSDFTPTSSSIMATDRTSSHPSCDNIPTTLTSPNHHDLPLLVAIRNDFLRQVSSNHGNLEYPSWTGQNALVSTDESNNETMSLQEILGEALQIAQEAEEFMLAELDTKIGED
jgi:hypothetical protein